MINHLKDYSFHEAIDHARSSWESRICHWGLIDELIIKAPKFAHGSSKHAGDHRSFVNETGSSSILTIWFVNAAKFVNGSSMVRQWFFNGSSISGDDNKSSSTTQKVRQYWRTGSSIVRQCARRVRQYWRTFWPLTNFLGHWRSFAVVSSYWRTIDELGCVYEPDRQYWRTACFIDELLWSAAYFEEPWVNCQTWALTSSSTIEK